MSLQFIRKFTAVVSGPHPRRYLWCVLTVLLLTCSGRDPVGPYECTMRIENRCWTQLGLEGQWIHALADTEWGLYAGTRENGVFRFSPQTREWEPLGLDHAIVSSILFVPGSPRRLLVGVSPYSDEQTAAAVFASEDRGRTWVAWDGGLAARLGNRAWAYSLALDPADASRVFMGQSYPLMRSTDGGRTWLYVWGSEDIFGNGINSIAVSPSQDGRVWAGGRTGVFAAAILRSEDGGENWRYIDPLPGDENEVSAVVIDPRNPDALWAAMSAGRGGVLYSSDAGVTWQWVLTIWERGVIADLALANGVLYAVAAENFRPAPDGQSMLSDLGLYRSPDWGISWDTLPVPQGVSGGYRITRSAGGGLLIGTMANGVWHVTP